MAKKSTPLALNSWQVKYFMEFSVYRDEAREWRWRLKHANGNIMAVSGEGYRRKSSCLLAVKHLKNRMGNAHVRVMDARTGRFHSLWTRP